MQASSISSAPFFKARLPLPPGINQSYKIVTVPSKARGGRIRYDRPPTVNRIGPSEALETFKRDAALMLINAKVDRFVIEAIQASTHKVPLQVSLTFYYRTLWRNDVDGGIKAAVDACFDCLGINDNRVLRIVVDKAVDRAAPHAEVEISCLVGR